MKYLLSTGKITSDVIEYIKDIIRLNMILDINQVPYFDGGSNKLITSILDSELQGKISIIVNQIIERITTRFDNISIQLEKISITNNLISVGININDITEYYDINRS